MRRLKKVVLAGAALAALAVGGAAFAGAQGAGKVAKVTVQQSSTAAESAMFGDTDKGQVGEQGGSDQGQVGEPDAASENDSPRRSR
jgi:hypothetical protein